MEQFWLSIGASSMTLAVALGAFGAHGLRKRVSEDSLRIWETANRYHFVHGLGLIAVAILARLQVGVGGQAMAAAFWLMVAGTLLFSGSLYVMTVWRRRWLGPITPLGGLAWIVAWVCLAVAGYSSSGS